MSDHSMKHQRDEARAECERLRAELALQESRCTCASNSPLAQVQGAEQNLAAAERERDEARAEVARLENELRVPLAVRVKSDSFRANVELAERKLDMQERAEEAEALASRYEAALREIAALPPYTIAGSAQRIANDALRRNG